ncbi:MAG: ABC transporter ATP-binding protein [Paracoccus sp. (in: a-proteobacteria)]|nr:ABC transporter ATP-binding protein [Paracoccus sp. (in: a-proteobacteria)]
MEQIIQPDDAIRTAAPVGAQALFSVRDLHVQFRGQGSLIHVVRGVSYDVRAGETVALVGESGCGKSVSSMAAMRLLAEPETTRCTGEVMLDGRPIQHLPEEAMRRIRGREIAMIFQEPMTALNPLVRIGTQITEAMREHLGLSAAEADARALDLLKKVGMTDPARRLRQYPHELSGGMRQRVLIAIALSCEPKLIIADEPTTALDVTIQTQILDLLKALTTEMRIGLLLITHNLGLVARYADRVNVMYAGQIVESGTTQQVMTQPRHRYTQGLLAAIPRLDRARLAELHTIPGQPPSPRAFPEGCAFRPRCPAATDLCRRQPDSEMAEPGHSFACHFPAEGLLPAPALQNAPVARAETAPILKVRGLTKLFHLRDGQVVTAVNGIDLDVPKGGTLGLVGESGCGKSTVARTLLRLEAASGGSADFEGRDLLTLDGRDLRAMRRMVQVIYQDPYTSLNPRHSIGRALAEPILVHGLAPNRRAAQARALELLEMVSLPADVADRYPHQMSGGQRQRVGIARALSMEPELIICDEPVSALDVSIQAQIINLLARLKDQLGLSFLFIAHDLAVVRHISDQIAVMYLGRVMERGRTEEVFANPRHPYTRALMEAVPSPDDITTPARAPAITGEIPSPLNPPAGCVFHTRCPFATPACREAPPEALRFSDTHIAACIRAKELQ